MDHSQTSYKKRWTKKRKPAIFSDFLCSLRISHRTSGSVSFTQAFCAFLYAAYQNRGRVAFKAEPPSGTRALLYGDKSKRRWLCYQRV